MKVYRILKVIGTFAMDWPKQIEIPRVGDTVKIAPELSPTGQFLTLKVKDVQHHLMSSDLVEITILTEPAR